MSTILSYLPYRLDDRVALVTSSGRGIGAAMAIELGRCGAKVIVNYANARDSAEKVVSELKSLGTDAVAFRADIRDVTQTTRLMDEAAAYFSGLEIACNNSRVVRFGHIGDVTEISRSSCCLRRELQGSSTFHRQRSLPDWLRHECLRHFGHGSKALRGAGVANDAFRQAAAPRWKFQILCQGNCLGRRSQQILWRCLHSSKWEIHRHG